MAQCIDHSVTLRRVEDELPFGFQALMQHSQDEGIKNMSMLQENWLSGAERFNKNGAALFGAFFENELIGLGGTTKEIGYTGSAMRMRRLFVLAHWRRKGVAGLIARQCMDWGLQSAKILTCNAQASAAAAPFWERMGFEPVSLPRITHIYSRRC
ncbi:MAG: GNAT family N-acetyltransferase [Pseudomonadota bacterium]